MNYRAEAQRFHGYGGLQGPVSSPAVDQVTFVPIQGPKPLLEVTRLVIQVVPAVYSLVARNTRSHQTISRLLDKLRAAVRRNAVNPGEEGGEA